MQSHWVVGLLAASLAIPVASAKEGAPRLKYRSKGAPCACASGIGEAEISKAMARLERLQEPGPAAPDDKRLFTEQPPRRETDDSRK